MGPKKLKAKTSSKDKDKKGDSEISKKLKAVLKEYELQCQKLKSKLDVELKRSLQDSITESKFLVRFTIHGPLNNNKDNDTINQSLDGILGPIKEVTNDNGRNVILPMKVSPLIKSLRINWYKNIKELYLWDLEIPREEITEINYFFSQPCYGIEYLEILECKMDKLSIFDLSSCISTNQSLTTLVLDYTNLQMSFLLSLCDGLSTTKTLKKLSLCYCNLCSKCGRPLGELVSQTSISELYLDGNFLECTGIIHLLVPFVEKSEEEYLERKSSLEASQAITSQSSSSAVGIYKSSTTKVQSTDSKPSTTTTKTKKKKKKKKSKVVSKVPPKVGAWLNVLHAVNVGLDSVSTVDENNLYEALHLICRLIITCEDLKEIDLDDNLIGEFGGREILSALQQRSQDGLKPIYMRTTHRIDSIVFKQIITLASRATKRGGKKKKKKKKGAAGKKRV